MNIKIFNLCMLIGWLLVLAGGVMISPGWGIAVAGGLMLFLSLVSAYIGGIHVPKAPRQAE
jgi:membrane protein implicated in regulation of membrane protease activity